MNVAQLIERKRDGGVLLPDEIRALIAGFTAGSVADYQMSAMAMAVFFRGLEPEELAVWTDAMMRSGEVVDLSAIPGKKIDKHSTGGVGDKVSLCLAPLVAACGLKVPMVSGRGLGHTGGTLDKLEAIPGFRVDLDLAHFARQIGEIGVCMIGQTTTLDPADRKLYALRDVTGTVASRDLICSSIMSKKLAEGIDGLVLDVKVGSGAFMKTMEDARLLAGSMIAIGQRLGKQVRALLTDMSQPLGRQIGNACETIEAIEVLRGEGPADLVELTLELGAEMLVLGGLARTLEEGRAQQRQAIRSGEALTVLRRMIAAQHGDPAAVDDFSLFPRATQRFLLTAPTAGRLVRIDTDELGWAGVELGAGRERVDSAIDPGVGMELLVRLGDELDAGEPVLVVSYNEEDRLARALRRLGRAFEIVPEGEVSLLPLVRERLGTEG